MRSISRHIMPLVTTSVGGGHIDTDTHIHTLRGQDQFLETRRAPACGWCAPGLKSGVRSNGTNKYIEYSNPN